MLKIEENAAALSADHQVSLPFHWESRRRNRLMAMYTVRESSIGALHPILQRMISQHLKSLEEIKVCYEGEQHDNIVGASFFTIILTDQSVHDASCDSDKPLLFRTLRLSEVQSIEKTQTSVGPRMKIYTTDGEYIGFTFANLAQVDAFESKIRQLTTSYGRLA